MRTAEDAERMEQETGCDAVMIGRGALINPFVFRQVMSRRIWSRYRWLTPAEIKRLILEQFHAILEGRDIDLDPCLAAPPAFGSGVTGSGRQASRSGLGSS